MADFSLAVDATLEPAWPWGELVLGLAALAAAYRWLWWARERPRYRVLALTGIAALIWGAAQTGWAIAHIVGSSWGGAAQPVAGTLFWASVGVGGLALLTVPLDSVAGAWVRMRAVSEAVLLSGATVLTLWVLVLRPVMDSHSVPFADRLDAVLWCIADAVLVFLVLLVARHGRVTVHAAGIRVWLLTAGLAMLGAGDVALHRVHVPELDATWPIALYLIGCVLIGLAPGRPGARPAPGPGAVVTALQGRGMPVAAAVTACAVALLVTASGGVDPVLLVGVGILVGALGLLHVPAERQGALTARHLESELDHRRTHDPLTDLLTRDALLDVVPTAGTRQRWALVLVRMRAVDAMRSWVGDALADRMLTVAAMRLRDTVHGLAMARWGDRDLAVLCLERDAAHTAELMVQSLGLPVVVGGRERKLDPVCAILPMRLTERTVVRDDASAALEAAEVPAVDSPVVFSTSLRAHAAARRRLGNDLEEAIAAGQLDIAVQPVMDVRTGHPAGAEALARWNHTDLGQISPSIFVPLAERRGCVDALGALVLDRALAEVVRWRQAGFTLPVSVNVSMLQLSGPGFSDLVAAALSRHRVPPGLLVLEVTETVLAEDTSAIRGTLTRLRELGVAVALDDFGTGYCSLAYLHTFPADVLKVDRALVEGATTDPQRAVLLRAVAAMADALGLDATAEGVGSQAEATLLVELGVAHGQGFWYARPMTPAAFAGWLARRPVPDPKAGRAGRAGRAETPGRAESPLTLSGEEVSQRPPGAQG